jgi:probable H4MPT-linked C1 transfer pathway protein
VKNIVGVDVGGANLKYARADGSAASQTFPMWRHPQRLADTIADDLGRFGQIDALAVTMTGELADCFADRAIGVEHIVLHVCRSASLLGIDEVSFYGVDGRFRDAEDARRDVDSVAAANWHALASFVAKEIASDAIMVDIGSTTTDVIPLTDGRVATAARTDHDRLLEGSLVYVGCRRTPVCALVDQLELRGRSSAVMNELFATIDDARLVLGTVEPDAEDCDTADGQPRTAEFAANRLARMIGLDRRTVTSDDARNLASQIIAAASQRIGESIATLGAKARIVLSGHGQEMLDSPQHALACDNGALASDNAIVRLSDQIGCDAARCAPSFAVAKLYHAETVEA